MTVVSFNARHTGEGQYPFSKGWIPAPATACAGVIFLRWGDVPALK